MITEMKTYPDIEKRIGEIGRELYASMNKVPSIFNRKRWMGRTMDLAMRDEEFKLNLFRYIDVLPSLKTDLLVAELFQEYFGKVKERAPDHPKGRGPDIEGFSALCCGQGDPCGDQGACEAVHCRRRRS